MNTTALYTSLRRLSVSVILIALFGTGCARFTSQLAPTPLPMLPARDLLLDAQAFPRNWGADPCEPDCNRREGATKALRVFGIVGVPGHVIQEVFRLGSEQAATDMFRTARETDFRERQRPNSGFVPPPEISYRSSIADEYHLGCGVDEVPACKVIMRKENYFISIFFNVDRGEVGGHGLKIDQIEPILRAFDERVAMRLGFPPTAAPPTVLR